uniref:DUF4485 domain-containing protein n=1 Tax=Macrostomum lignano TaxID=282301 RepID=A0A1I8FI90_9PLAT
MNPVKKRFFEKLLLIAEQRRSDGGEFLRLVKHLDGTSNEQICLKYLAEAAFFSWPTPPASISVADLPNQGVKHPQQHIAIGLKILPRIESPANRWRLLFLAWRLPRESPGLGRSNLLEELIKLLPPPLPDDQLFGEKNYSEAEIANIGSRNRGNRRRPSDCRLGGGDCRLCSNGGSVPRQGQAGCTGKTSTEQILLNANQHQLQSAAVLQLSHRVTPPWLPSILPKYSRCQAKG